MTFNTVEDVNGTQFDNQGFWWHKIDLSKFTTGTEEYSNIKIDFCTLSRRNDSTTTWNYYFSVENSLFSNLILLIIDGTVTFPYYEGNPPVFSFIGNKNELSVELYLYMGPISYENPRTTQWFLLDNILELNYKQLKQNYNVPYALFVRPSQISRKSILLNQGYNLITDNYFNNPIGYLLVKLLKTDFQFSCNQQLIVGEVNTVQLGTLTDYKPNGDLVGEYATKLSVLYNGKTIPVVWNSALNDYTFDLDLTNLQEEKRVRFKVIVETNDVLNASETDVALDCKFETIDTLAKLIELFRIGGTGRLSSDLTLTNDLTLSKSVNLIGNECIIDMASHKLVIPSDKTFKAQSVGFSNGINTLQQEPNSTVELTDCTFTDCTGFGSVIDCQVDLASLDDSDDFNTKLTNCTISNCDMAILHGGNLEVTGCTVNGKISNKNYPYFLYQTDGNATILNSQFNLRDTMVFDYDIEFNSCIFTCGETATINGYSHTELQQNNRSAFFDTQRNTSIIDVKYYYSLIEDTVHLQSDKGFCHSVSGVDYIFKSNVTITRGE